MNLSKETIIAFLKEHKYAVLLGLVGLGFLGTGIFSLVVPAQEEALSFQSSETRPAPVKETKVEKHVIVDVSGAVNKPGVYELASTSRVQDAIAAAGGFSSQADTTKIAQSLNLAAPLTDGAKLYVPTVGEQMTASAGVSGKDSGTAVLGDSTGMININTADEAMLDSLPGVGKVTAGKIIANRPYGAIDDLLAKKVVGKAVLEKIRGEVTVY